MQVSKQKNSFQVNLLEVEHVFGQRLITIKYFDDVVEARQYANKVNQYKLPGHNSEWTVFADFVGLVV